MHLLFVHQNYPAQFGHIARHLVERHAFRCTFVSERPAGNDHGIQRLQYQIKGGATNRNHYCSRSFENGIWHAHAVYEALEAQPNLKPDLIIGHSGFGSTLLLPELYSAPIINYFEYFYRSHDSDMDFRPEFPPLQLDRLRARARNAMLLLDLETCQAGYSPTNWQRGLFPTAYQHKLETIFDGVDTRLWHPRTKPARDPLVIKGREIPADVKLVTYVSRGFESMRGFDIFMRVAKRIYEARSDVLFVCVGSDRICYGGDEKHIKARSFREHVLSQDTFDLSRFLFPGMLPTEELAAVLRATDLHIYLTVPFVLSWSLMNALASGATVLASGTEPVEEMIRHNENGLLADFYDVEGFTRQALEVLADPPAYRRLGQASAEMIARDYSLEVVLPRMLALYERVAAGSAA